MRQCLIRKQDFSKTWLQSSIDISTMCNFLADQDSVIVVKEVQSMLDELNLYAYDVVLKNRHCFACKT